MIGSNLFQINYNWKIIDDEFPFFIYLCHIDNFQLLWTPVIKILNMINNTDNIEDRYHIRIDVESFNSVTSDLSDISYNLNLYRDPSYDESDWKVILETPRTDALKPLINIRHPGFEIRETIVYPYFWNNNNIAIKVQYYLRAIFDPDLDLINIDNKRVEYLILYDIETEKWKFIEINPSNDFQILIVDNKFNFVLLGEESVNIPICNPNSYT